MLMQVLQPVNAASLANAEAACDALAADWKMRKTDDAPWPAHSDLHIAAASPASPVRRGRAAPRKSVAAQRQALVNALVAEVREAGYLPSTRWDAHVSARWQPVCGPPEDANNANTTPQRDRASTPDNAGAAATSTVRLQREVQRAVTAALPPPTPYSRHDAKWFTTEVTPPEPTATGLDLCLQLLYHTSASADEAWACIASALSPPLASDSVCAAKPVATSGTT